MTNTGDVDHKNVVVTDTTPVGNRIVSADGGTVNQNVITWNIADLASGASKSYKVVLMSKTPGEQCNTASVSEPNGLTESSKACTLWKGHPALLIELVDSEDPLLPGDTTTYTIRITNQGTADDHNVRIKAMFSEHISPVTASGSTPITINGTVVTSQPKGVLKPGGVIEWKIKGKANKKGDSRLHIEMNSDLLKTPVHEEESTYVY